MVLKFFNTLTRKKEEFVPLTPGHVKMYNCGPTVYNYAHIGNFRAFVCGDVLKRYLLYKGLKVTQVMNITDVDDKTIRDSQKEGKSLKEFCEFYTKAFLEDMETLNTSKPDTMPKATEHVDEMVAMIKRLMDLGIAYKAEDGIYYSIAKFKEYGKLSKIDLSQTQHGKRAVHDEYDKDDVHDFALWKFWDEKDGDVFWETELGKGRPGWHIECSAMSSKYLGESFDIHTGGIDLVFPHHENEIAQIEPCSGEQFVQVWLHNEYILVDGKKMSKSLGNFHTLRDLLDKGYDAKAIRYLLLSTHYRTQLNFTLEGIDAAQHTVDKLLDFVSTMKRVKTASVSGEVSEEVKSIVADVKQKFEGAMDDDLNVAEALGHVFEGMKEINRLYMDEKVSSADASTVLDMMYEFDMLLGVLEGNDEAIPQDVVNLAEKREEARKVKDFKASDALRGEIKSKGYDILDTKEGYQLKRV
jgi:cysteinyl-tRNA synthetase